MKHVRPAFAVARAAALALLAAAALVAAIAAMRHFAETASREATAEFLARHWSQPIAPQGDAPAAFTRIN